MYALDCSCGVFISENNLHMYNHHICRACALKTGIADYMDARKAKEKEEKETEDKEEPTE
nr:MAG TPA: hypothetical protein [Caudoviricetes sp.]